MGGLFTPDSRVFSCWPGVDHYYIKLSLGMPLTHPIRVFNEALEPLAINQSSHSLIVLFDISECGKVRVLPGKKTFMHFMTNTGMSMNLLTILASKWDSQKSSKDLVLVVFYCYKDDSLEGSEYGRLGIWWRDDGN